MFQSPFSEVVKEVDFPLLEIGDPQNDDPTLAFLFAHLRDWSLSTLKGAASVSPETEFKVRRHSVLIWRSRWFTHP